MSRKLKVITAVLIVTVAFAFGRYSAPEKVKEVTKVEEHKSEEKDKDKVVHRHKKTKTVTIQNPDGSKTTTTTTDDDFNKDTNSKTVVKDDKKSEIDKEVTYSKSKLTLSALAAENIHAISASPIYGGMVSKEVLGPITVGGFGLQNGIVGLSLGLTF